MFNRKRLKAQTTLEYAILIGVIVAGLIAMQTYIKRGYQGKLRESADSMGEQFSPGHTTNTYTTTSNTTSKEKLDLGTSETYLDQDSSKNGNESVEKVTNVSGENWW